MKAEIWTKTNCPFCVRAKRLLIDNNIPYTEYVLVAEDEKVGPGQKKVTKDDLLKRYPEAKTVPQIWLDGRHVGGFTELAVKLPIKP